MSLKVIDSQCGPAYVPEAPGTGADTDASIHILLVDDDTLARHVVRKALEKCHYKVTAVTSAQEAIRVLESTDVDTFQLILTDVVMPVGGDGLDLLEHVKSNVVWRSIPVVMMSANECIDTVRECLQRGASHYILKPVTQKEIKSLWQYAYRSATRPALTSDEPEAPASPTPDGAAPATEIPTIATKPAGPCSTTDSHITTPAPSISSLAPEGTNMPLNSALESLSLPWRTRLTVFCQLLHNTRTAFDVPPPSSAAALPPRSQPFSNAASILISPSTGAVASCHTPPHHFSTYFYRAPFARGPAATAPYSRTYDAASATYALGILLLELAMAPSPPKVRTAYLSALPRVPATLLSSKPDIAVLILRMTAANAGERPSLVQVTRERAVHAVYSTVAAAASVVANQQAAGSVVIRRAFLRQVQKSRQEHIADVTADLECLESDLSRVQAALQQVQKESGRLQAHVEAGAAASGAAAETSGAPGEGGAALAARPAHITWPRRRRACGSDNGMGASGTEAAAGGADGATGSSSGDRSGVDAGLAAADQTPAGEHASRRNGVADVGAAKRRGKHTGAIAVEGGDENPPKRQRVASPDSSLKPTQLSDSEGQTIVAIGGGSATGGCGSCKRNGAVGGAAPVDLDYASDSTLKHQGATDEDGCTPAAPTPAATPAPQTQSEPFPDAVCERWNHVSPLAMQLFGGYCAASRLGRADAVGDAAAGAAAGCADPHLRSAPWLRSVASDLQAVARFRWLPVVSSVQHAPSNTLDGNSGRRMVCAVALDRCEENLAVIGVNKTIRLFRFANMTDEHLRPSEPRYPVNDLTVRSKLTSGCFNAYLQHRLAIADSDGGVTLLDTAANAELMQFEEHVNRVWSVDCSPHDPALLLSASMDKTVRLWSTAQEESVAMIVETHQVCSAVFHPQNANLLALGTANAALKLYDIRRLDAPLGTAAAPRAVSYVRFMGDHVVAAAVDSVICMYETAAVARGVAAGGGAVEPVRRFRGHLNQRHFVGLACSPEGYIFTGSEANSVCMYHRSVPSVLAEQPVLTQDAMGGGLIHGAERPIVNCLTVDKGLKYVVSGGTTGWVNVMRLTA